jgi:hypothetical protein
MRRDAHRVLARPRRQSRFSSGLTVPLRVGGDELPLVAGTHRDRRPALRVALGQVSVEVTRAIPR